MYRQQVLLQAVWEWCWWPWSWLSLVLLLP
jgi:hypothetical protein